MLAVAGAGGLATVTAVVAKADEVEAPACAVLVGDSRNDGSSVPFVPSAVIIGGAAGSLLGASSDPTDSSPSSGFGTRRAGVVVASVALPAFADPVRSSDAPNSISSTWSNELGLSALAACERDADLALAVAE